jgi:hypothetical protein
LARWMRHPRVKDSLATRIQQIGLAAAPLSLVQQAPAEAPWDLGRPRRCGAT